MFQLSLERGSYGRRWSVDEGERKREIENTIKTSLFYYTTTKLHSPIYMKLPNQNSRQTKKSVFLIIF